MSDKLIVYGHPACPMIPPVLGMLKQAKVEYDYINIFKDPAARQRLREINQGYESVPTLVFPDGSTLTEPTAGRLRKHLQATGHEVPLTALLVGNLYWLIILAGVGLVILRGMGVF